MNTVQRVALLEREVAERIAAGEVIERPASVVKELVENALDAGARRIGVELRGGGLESIRISDDGCGLGRDDLGLAVQRFATSKIRRWEDLDALDTYGFRGEALPSVAAVSQFDIVSRPPDSDWGWRLLMRGGTLQRLEEAGVPVGTTVLVTELFFNTPARKKFLKAAVSEAARVQDIVGAMSLAAPHVQFTVRHNGKLLLDLPAEVPLLERLRRVWGVKTDQTFLELQGAVTGWVSTPDLLWPNRRKLLLFVNRRLISSPALCYAVSDGVGAGRGRYPLGVVLLNVPGDSVDVNVHPTKAEVRFRDGEAVFRLVRQEVARAVRSVVPSRPSGPPLPPPPTDWRHAALEPFAAWPDPRPAEVAGAAAAAPATSVGRLGVAVAGGQVWVVEPHVYTERRLRSRMLGAEPPATLVFPLLLELPAGTAARLPAALPALAQAGLVLEAFGPGTWLVRSVPSGGERLADGQRLCSLLVQHAVGEDWVPRFVLEAACAAACPGAVSAEVLDRMLAEVEDADLVPERGAHGRAAVLRLDEARLQHLLATQMTT